MSGGGEERESNGNTPYFNRTREAEAALEELRTMKADEALSAQEIQEILAEYEAANAEFLSAKQEQDSNNEGGWGVYDYNFQYKRLEKIQALAARVAAKKGDYAKRVAEATKNNENLKKVAEDTPGISQLMLASGKGMIPGDTRKSGLPNYVSGIDPIGVADMIRDQRS